MAIVGGGYTGLSAALHLAADHGVDVALLEANGIGWGASGRNGGFACIGGAKVSDAVLASRFGTEGLDEWHRVQKASADLVADLLERHAIEADAHSRAGEVVMAHRASDMAALRAEAPVLGRSYGVEVDLIERTDLVSEGLAGPQFHGAMRFPLGFALNPLKYALGLARGARKAGARIHEQSAVTRIERGRQGGYVLHAGTGRIEAKRLILATNGYSSEDLPDWMCARYLPAQSCVLVTRPLAAAEIGAQGWSSDHMAYDTRRLLHYFRLMPNRRFLFGMRGGTSGTQAAHRGMETQVRRHFEALFPAWAGAATEHTWSGFVCLTGSLAPFVGEVPGAPGLHAAFGWHGSGVAAASYSGRQIGRLMTGKPAHLPDLVRRVPRRFPIASLRRTWLRLAYAGYALKDGPLPGA